MRLDYCLYLSELSLLAPLVAYCEDNYDNQRVYRKSVEIHVSQSTPSLTSVHDLVKHEQRKIFESKYAM